MQKLVHKQPKKINLNLELFEESITSEFTRKVYTTCLKIYFHFPGPSKFIQCEHTTDVRKVEDHIINFVITMKKEGKGFSGIKNYVTAIYKYYRTKRVYLNTKHINEYLPEFKKSKKDRPYTHEEIADLQTYISSYYDASRYVMEKSVQGKDDKQNESESISIV
jgi:hypothetical protein